MGFRKTHAISRLGAVALALMLLLAACGGSDDDGEGAGGGGSDAAEDVLPSETGPIGDPGDEGDPVDGGVLRVLVTGSDPGGLDPVKNLGSGQTGLSEITAIYDSLLRFDPVANEYVPQLAESITANGDNTEYTLKLRPDVKFTDGTPLDAAAVKFGFERFSGPASLQVYGSILPQIASMETPDDLTVVIKLVGPDPSFPFMLTLSFGQVVSPTAVKTMGDEAFNLKPVGAGPFMVKRYEPNVGLSLERNPDYWGPAPHLEGLEFTFVYGDGARLDALESGDVDVVMITEPAKAVDAFEKGYTGFGWVSYGSPIVSMNMREGRPFADQRLRRAVALALDEETVSTRVFKGLNYPSKEFFPAGLLSSGEPGIAADRADAEALVQEVKDETGWDGKFTLLASPDAIVHDTALSVQAMLNNVGFDAAVETPSDWTTAVYATFDYDAVVTSLGLMETDPAAFLVYEAGGAYSPTGLSDPRLDEAILELRAAASEAETKAATKKVQELWNEIVPSVFLGYRVDRMFQAERVKGVVPTASTALLFHEAWLSD